MNTIRFLWPVLLFCAAVLAADLASAAPTPEYKEITAPEVRKMIEERHCLLVHSLSRIEFEIQHIENSVNIPVNEMETSTELPDDKSVPLIFYCMGKR